jgi:hypothetical protein
MEISGGEVEKKYFSVSEANSMIPFLERSFVRIIQLQHKIRRLYSGLDEIGFAPDSETFEIHAVEAPTGVIHHRGTLKALIESLRDELQRVHNKGALVRGLKRGLVDWYSRRGGQDIFLCWALGEPEVRHWHPVEGGHPGRRPIEELER